jgi:hypothetical protein
MARLRVPRLDAIAYPRHDVNPLIEESVAREAVFSVTATEFSRPYLLGKLHRAESHPRRRVHGFERPAPWESPARGREMAKRKSQQQKRFWPRPQPVQATAGGRANLLDTSQQ